MRPKYNPNAVNKKPYDSIYRKTRSYTYSVLYYTVHTTQHSDNIRTDETIARHSIALAAGLLVLHSTTIIVVSITLSSS